jgi:hypothetical protein
VKEYLALTEVLTSRSWEDIRNWSEYPEALANAANKTGVSTLILLTEFFAAINPDLDSNGLPSHNTPN